MKPTTPNHFVEQPLMRISLACFALVSLANSASAQGIKADNGTALNLSGSWVSGTSPNSGTLMIVDSTLTANQSSSLGDNLSVLGITASSAKNLQINNTATKTLTIGASGINSSGAGALTFNNATSLGGNITLANTPTGTVTFSSLTLTANQSWAIGGTSNQNRINLGGTLTTGGNTLNISAANANYGLLNITANNTLGSEVTIGTMGRVYVQGGATVTFAGTNNTHTEFMMFGGTANIASMGNLNGASSIGKGIAQLHSGNTLNYTGTTFSSDKGLFRGNGVNGTSTMKVTTAGQTLSMGGNITSTGVTGGWNFGGAGNLILSGVVNNATSTTLTKQDTGTLTLTNSSNSYTGATTVEAGKLIIDGNISTSTTTVKTTGSLGGAGTLGAVIVESNGKLAPGTDIGSLAATGNVALNAGSIFEVQIDTASSYDQLGISNGGDLNIGAGAKLDLVNFGSASLIALNARLQLIDYSSFGGAWNGGLFTLGTEVLSDSETFAWQSNTWRINYDDTLGGGDTSLSNGGSYVTLTAIPEPNAAAMIGGCGMLMLLRRRKA